VEERAVTIVYRKLSGYKYSLLNPYHHVTPFELNKAIATRMGWVRMNREGMLRLKKGYAWDGPSGPTIDTKDFMRGSLVHDALYQLIREKLLPTRYRKAADEVLRTICRDDGMSKTRADYVYHAVRAFGASAARPPKKPKKVRITAP
jgi:hypothetical protein